MLRCCVLSRLTFSPRARMRIAGWSSRASAPGPVRVVRHTPGAVHASTTSAQGGTAILARAGYGIAQDRTPWAVEGATHRAVEA